MVAAEETVSSLAQSLGAVLPGNNISPLLLKATLMRFTGSHTSKDTEVEMDQLGKGNG